MSRKGLFLSVISLLVLFAGAGVAVARVNSVSAPDLRVSFSDDRTSSQLLDGQIFSTNTDIYVFLTEAGVSGPVSFYLDDLTMSGSPIQVENSAPWDFAGGNANANAFNTGSIAAGIHAITAAYDTMVISATFEVLQPDKIPPLYSLELDGQFVASFHDLEGLSSFSDLVISQVVGPSGELIVSKTPGDFHWGEITLRRGFTGNLELWDWRSQVLQGDPLARQDGSIVVRNQALQEVARVDFKKGWPSRWAIEDPEGQGTAVEEITIAHDGLVSVQ